MPHSDFVPENEALIFKDLSDIRQQLSVIKRDHSKFLNSKDINDLYRLVLVKVKKLNVIRRSGNKSIIKVKNEQNKVDILIDEIFQLLSLCFVTCGLTKLAPSTYASLSTVHRLLEHINESEIFTHNDLMPIKERLDEISKIISEDEENSKDPKDDVAEFKKANHITDEEDTSVLADEEDDGIDNTDEINLLKEKLNECIKEYKLLEDKINRLPKEYQNDLNKLVLIKRSLMDLINHEDSKDEEEEVDERRKTSEALQNKTQIFKLKTGLQSIEANLADQLNETNESIGIIKGLIDDCHNLINDLEMGVDKIDPDLKEIYSQLISLKSTLENLLVTRRWTLRTTDIFNYQRDLKAIDDRRVNGLFIGKNGESTTPKKGQVILLYLLRRCFAIIYKLLESSEPVSETLQPLHNQLSTVRRCLLDLKRMGVISSLRELYPYQLKLASIDNLRQDGKFIIQNQIPEGQGTLNALLAECFDILHELKIEYYERQEELEEQEKLKKSLNSTVNEDGSTSYQNQNSSSVSLLTSKMDNVNIMGTKAAQEENYNYNNELYDDNIENQDDDDEIHVLDYDESYQNSIIESEDVTDIDNN